MIDGALKLALLMVITLAVGGIGWAALGPPVPAGPVATTEAARAAQLARARVAADWADVAQVTIDIDGLHVAATGRTDQSVQELLDELGVQLVSSDRLSVHPGQKLVSGMRLVLDRGIPVTIVDGGQAAAMRAPRGTVAELLALRGIVLGALDQLDVPGGTELVPGSVVTVTRVAELEVTEPVTIAFAVRTVNAPDLETGRQQVETAGVAGEAVRTWIVRYVNGVESARSLVSETVARAPVDEVRRIGTRPPPAPAAPAPAAPAPAPAASGDIESIIRAAAARWGANPDQLLRVAWCESRYNPLAYNSSSGASGLFQFIPSTWAAYSPRAGYGGVSPFNAVANANTAAMMFAQGQAGQWVCK